MEIRYKVQLLDRLRETQQAAVACFLAQNRAVLEEFAQALAERRRLSKEEMQPFFAQVYFPPEIPQVHMTLTPAPEEEQLKIY